MIVKAVEGRLVRDPATLRQLPPEGLHAADNDLHWSRLAEDGDVTTEPDPAPAAPAAPTPAPTEEVAS